MLGFLDRISAVLPAAAALPSPTRPPQVRSLIESADALAITEHGQFLRTPESCKASAALVHSQSACLLAQLLHTPESCNARAGQYSTREELHLSSLPAQLLHTPTFRREVECPYSSRVHERNFSCV